MGAQKAVPWQEGEVPRYRGLMPTAKIWRPYGTGEWGFEPGGDAVETVKVGWGWQRRERR